MRRIIPLVALAALFIVGCKSENAAPPPAPSPGEAPEASTETGGETAPSSTDETAAPAAAQTTRFRGNTSVADVEEKIGSIAGELGFTLTSIPVTGRERGPEGPAVFVLSHPKLLAGIARAPGQLLETQILVGVATAEPGQLEFSIRHGAAVLDPERFPRAAEVHERFVEELRGAFAK